MQPGSDHMLVEESRTFSQNDFDQFARISGDANPIHVDPEFAAATRFGATVAHGMLLFSAIRGLIARHYSGSRLISQSLMFPAPVYADETVALRLEASKIPDSNMLRLAVTITKADCSKGLQGDCILRLAEEVV